MLPTVAPFLHGDGPEGSLVADWLPSLVWTCLAVGCYLVAVSRHGRRRGRPWSRWRTASWVAGAGMVGLAVSPVLDTLARQPTAHMVQHVILGMLAPLALVLGAPVTLLLAASSPALGRRVGRLLRRRVVHVLSHPAPAAALAVGGLYVVYLTPLHALSSTHDAVEHGLHVHFVVAGYVYSWSIAGPDPAPRRPGLRTRVAVLVLAAAAHGYLAKLLYARAADLPPGHAHPVAEMEQAAQWMYYGGDVAEVLLAAALFASWYRATGRSASRPVTSGSAFSCIAGKYLANRTRLSA